MWRKFMELFKQDFVAGTILMLKIVVILLSIIVYFNTNKLIVDYTTVGQESETIQRLRTMIHYSLIALVVLYTYRVYMTKECKIDLMPLMTDKLSVVSD